jgi:hypothetical protein
MPWGMTKRLKDNPSFAASLYLTRVVRIDVPVRSVVNLRRVAENLRGLADRLDFLSREPRDADEILLEASFEARRCHRRMQAIQPPGRPSSKKRALKDKHKM